MRWTLIALIAVSSTGCLVSHSRKKVIREHEPLRPVQFQSPDVANQFNQILRNERSAKGSSFSFGVPFLLGLSGETVPSANAHSNDHSLRCDTDGDCVITEAEVAAYASR